MTTGILPDSRCRVISTPKGATPGHHGMYWVPIFCASCGVEGGKVPEKNTTFAFWLCHPCYAVHGAVAGTMAVPDEMFWQLVAEEQTETYGRPLTAEETVVSLADPESLESRLARDRSVLTPHAGG